MFTFSRYKSIKQLIKVSSPITLAEDRILDADVFSFIGGISVWNFSAVCWKEKVQGFSLCRTAHPMPIPLNIVNKESGFIGISDVFKQADTKWRNCNYGYSIPCTAWICFLFEFVHFCVLSKQGHFGMQHLLIPRLPTSTSPHSMESSVLMCPSSLRPQPFLGYF